MDLLSGNWDELIRQTPTFFCASVSVLLVSGQIMNICCAELVKSYDSFWPTYFDV